MQRSSSLAATTTYRLELKFIRLSLILRRVRAVYRSFMVAWFSGDLVAYYLAPLKFA